MGNSKPRLVLFGAHRWKREGIIECARRSGFEPVLAMFENESLSVAAKEIGAENLRILRLSSKSTNISDLVNELSQSNSDWAATGLDDYVCDLAAALSEHSPLGPTMPRTAARAVLHKHILRSKWNALASLDPRLYPVSFRLQKFSNLYFKTIVDIQESPTPSAGPFIVKPDALDASIGIYSAADAEEIPDKIERMSSELIPMAEEAKSIGIEITPDVLIEHKIPRSTDLHPGAEFSAEFLSIAHGKSGTTHLLIGITQKYIHPDTFVELAHSFPSELFPQTLRPALQDATSALLDDLGVRFCISHWEYIVTNDARLALVEAQLRPAGDNIMDLVSRATQRNPLEVLFKGMKGEAVYPTFEPSRIAAIFFPTPIEDLSGALSIVGNVDKLGTELPGNFTLLSEFSGNQGWEKKTKWNSRLIRIVGEGTSFSTTRENCERLISQLTIECKDSLGNTRRVGLTL